MRFYLGTHETSWLPHAGVPLFVSHTRLRKRRVLPRAAASWALDSGGFTELSRHGGWRTTVGEYVDAVDRYATEIGRLDWAAPMDWMCEPRMIENTGLSVREHQERTVMNYLELRGRGPFIPVLQGWALADYHRCVDLYETAGVDLAAEPLVGLGTVCRRQGTAEIRRVVSGLADRGLRLHGFGVKKRGLPPIAHLVASADSMAWSTAGRMDWHHRREQSCGGAGDHRGSCANCSAWALRWRRDLTDRLGLFAESPKVIIPGTPSESPGKGRFMETAGIEPALCFGRIQLPVPLRDRTGATIAYAVIDAKDAHLLGFRWHLDSDSQRVGGKMYARRADGVYLHREVIGPRPTGLVVDHINGLTLDNRRANLRFVTVAENAQNPRRRHAGPKRSRYRGVTWRNDRRTWRASHFLDGKLHYIGTFADEDDAGAAAAAWRAEHMPFSAEAAALCSRRDGRNLTRERCLP